MTRVIHPALANLQGKLIVSVQAERHEPLGTPATLIAMAQSVLSGGAAGLRLADLDVIQAMRQMNPTLPLIGLTKPEPIPADAVEQVYITPTRQDCVALIEAGTSVVAMDATLRPHQDPLRERVQWLKQHYPQIALMADVDTVEGGLAAVQDGFDCIGTTLSGYTTATVATKNPDEPDWELLASLCKQAPVPIIAEGRIWHPEHATQAQRLGAYCVVVGSAITRPQLLTQRFNKALGVS